MAGRGRAAIDLTGQRFGRLEVLYRNGSTKHKKAVWHCKCDCGNEKDIIGSELRNGRIVSCGCYHKEQFRQMAHSRRQYSINPGDKIGSLTILEEIQMGQYKCLCDCGREFITTGKILSVGDATTCGCGINRINHTFIDETGNKYGKLTVLEYIGTDKNHQALWKCRCDCGNEKITTGHLLRNGDVISCGCLKRSYGEEKIHQILTEQKVNFQEEYSFEDCRSRQGVKLRFDFAIFKKQTLYCLIEFQGEQHTKAVNYFGGEEALKLTQERDNIKKEYCKKHNIRLIEIPYSDRDKLNWKYLKEKCNL